MLNVGALTNTLSRMPLPELQKYAALHKNDPYVVSLALSIANQKKQMMASQAGQAGMQPQPKVVDQAIAEMAPVVGALPEDVGIGALPAQNMQRMAGGGIVAFEGGGEIPGYKAGGSLQDYIQKYAEQYKVSPITLSKIVRAESENKPEAKNPKSSAQGVGQLIHSMWEKMGGGEKGDVETQVKNAAKLLRSNTENFVSATGRTPTPSESYVTWVLGDSTGRAVLQADPNASVEDVIKKADPDRAAKIISSNPNILKNKKVGDVTSWASAKLELPTTKVGTSAQAQPKQNIDVNQIPGSTSSAPPKQIIDASQIPGYTASAQNTVSPLSQIPGQTSKAPAPTPEDTGFLSPEWFQQKAENVGLSRDVGRNVFNTLMAPTPAAPVTTLPSRTSGLAALGEKIYNKFVPAAGMSEKEIAALRAETEAARAAELAKSGEIPLRLTPPSAPVPAGTATMPVTPGGQAVVQSAADLEKVRLANQAADQLAATEAATRAAKTAETLPSLAERLQQASYIRESDEAARLMSRAKAASTAKQAAQTATGVAALAPEPEVEAAPVTGGMPSLNEAFRKFEIEQQNAEERNKFLPKPEEAPTEVAAAPEEKKGGMDWNDFMLKMGLHLMSGESPNALTNVGKAGLGTLAMQQAEAKAKSEEEAKRSEAEYRKAMGKYYGAYGEAIERGAKEKNNVALAEKAAIDAYKAWADSNKVQIMTTPGLAEQKMQDFRAQMYRHFGIEPTITTGAPAGQRLIYNPETGKIG